MEKIPQSLEESQDMLFEASMAQVHAKWNKYGPLFLTPEDHKNMGSTRFDLQSENKDKKEYEIMSDQELEAWIDERVDTLESTNLDKLEESGLGKIIRHEIVTTISLLKEVGRLPAKYTDFDILK